MKKEKKMRKENLEKGNKIKRYFLKTKSYKKRKEAVELLQEIQKRKIHALLVIENNQYRIVTKEMYEEEAAEQIKKILEENKIEVEKIEKEI